MKQALPTTLLALGLFMTASMAGVPATNAATIDVTPGLSFNKPDGGNEEAGEAYNSLGLEDGPDGYETQEILDETDGLCVAEVDLLDKPFIMPAGTRLFVSTPVHITEGGTKEERWETELDVQWNSAPASFPINDVDDREFTDTKGETDVYNTELKLEWAGNNFDQAGTYRFNAAIGISYEDKNWKGSGSSTFVERCSASADGDFTIEVQDVDEEQFPPSEVCVRTVCLSWE